MPKSSAAQALATILAESQLANEIQNFPSLEGADGAQPEWWEELDANATLTEEDVSGEGITENYERCLKVVVAVANSYAYQRYTYANEPRIKSGRKLSVVCAVWSVGGVSARVRLQSSVGSLGVSPDITLAGWTIVTVDGVELDGTWVDIRLEVDIGTAYFVPLGVNIGSVALPLPPRGLTYRHKDNPADAKDFAGIGDEAAWTDIDVTASTSPIAVMVHIHTYIRENNGNKQWAIHIRRNGSSQAAGANNRMLYVRTNAAIASFEGGISEIEKTIVLDDGQVFEYYLDRLEGAGTVLSGHVYVLGYWEWA